MGREMYDPTYEKMANNLRDEINDLLNRQSYLINEYKRINEELKIKTKALNQWSDIAEKEKELNDD